MPQSKYKLQVMGLRGAPHFYSLVPKLRLGMTDLEPLPHQFRITNFGQSPRDYGFPGGAWEPDEPSFSVLGANFTYGFFEAFQRALDRLV